MKPPVRRAAVFTGHFLPHVGGVEVYTYELWRRLVKRGWEVVLVTSDVGGGAADETIEGMRIVRMPTIAFRNGQFPLPSSGRALRSVLNILDGHKPAVISTNLRFMPQSWMGAAYARARKIPLLHIEQSSGPIEAEGMLTSIVSNVVDRTLGRWLIGGAAMSAGVSPASEAYVRKLGATRTAVLRAGIEPPEHREESRRAWREKLGLATDDVAVLFRSRVVESKGVFELLDAWQRLNDPRAHLVIGPDGPDWAEVQRRVATLPRVHAVGQQRQGEVVALMTACDIFVHPSKAAEGMPLTILEAAAAELPIIATPQGGTAEVVESGQTGYLIPVGGPVAITEALRKLIASESDRVAFGRAAKARALKSYGWPGILDSAEQMLFDIQR